MRERGYLVLLALGVAFLVVVNLPPGVSHALRAAAREALAPYQAWASRLMTHADRVVETVGDFDRVRTERNRLAAENGALRTRVRNAESLERRNIELGRLLALARTAPSRTVACEVIARDAAGGWWQAVRLDRGASSRIVPNLPVLTADGLVGRTRDVSGSACDVLLISDPNSRVGVRFARSGTCGILAGGGLSPDGDPRLAVLAAAPAVGVEYVDRNADIRTNDVVVTSGLGGVFPADIPVGTVRRVDLAPSRLYRRVDVTPCADLARLRYVLVELPRNGLQAVAAPPAAPTAAAEDASP